MSVGSRAQPLQMVRAMMMPGLASDQRTAGAEEHASNLQAQRRRLIAHRRSVNGLAPAFVAGGSVAIVNPGLPLRKPVYQERASS